MPLPAAAVAALILGGGLAATEVSSRMASARLHKRNLEYLDRFGLIEKGKAMDASAAVLQATGQMPATKATPVPTTKAPEAPEARLEPEEPEPEAILQPRKAGYDVTPRMLKEQDRKSVV